MRRQVKAEKKQRVLDKAALKEAVSSMAAKEIEEDVEKILEQLKLQVRMKSNDSFLLFSFTACGSFPFKRISSSKSHRKWSAAHHHPDMVCCWLLLSYLAFLHFFQVCCSCIVTIGITIA